MKNQLAIRCFVAIKFFCVKYCSLKQLPNQPRLIILLVEPYLKLNKLNFLAIKQVLMIYPATGIALSLDINSVYYPDGF